MIYFGGMFSSTGATLTVHSGSPEKTKEVANALSRLLFPGSVLLLKGDLGAGKTLFASGLAEGLGIQEAITSPTFNILKAYEEGRLPFNHIDAYRLNEGNADIGLEDYIYGDGITAIEWPDFIAGMLPDERLELELVPLGESERELRFLARGKKYEGILWELEGKL